MARITKTQFDDIVGKARACRLCAAHLPLGPRPVFQVDTKARILIAGQAPGRRVHETGIPFNDPSGERLRAWMGVDAATFYDPVSVVADADGNLYVSDHHNDRVRRIDQKGMISAFAGTGVRGFSGDGGPATSAKLNQPWALTVCDGTLYITDSFNARVRTVGF